MKILLWVYVEGTLFIYDESLKWVIQFIFYLFIFSSIMWIWLFPKIPWKKKFESQRIWFMMYAASPPITHTEALQSKKVDEEKENTASFISFCNKQLPHWLLQMLFPHFFLSIDIQSH